MTMTIYLLQVGATYVDSDNWSLDEAVNHLRSVWNEDEDTPQAFSVVDDAGVVQAVLIRPHGEPTLCHTLFRNGDSMSHVCRYEFDDAGQFVGSVVEAVARRYKEVADTDHDDSTYIWTLEATFRLAWRTAAAAGQCDEIDGAEYKRCFRAWLSPLKKSDIVSFIRECANVPSGAGGAA
jgi:hypothetical protein